MDDYSQYINSISNVLNEQSEEIQKQISANDRFNQILEGTLEPIGIEFLRESGPTVAKSGLKAVARKFGINADEDIDSLVDDLQTGGVQKALTNQTQKLFTQARSRLNIGQEPQETQTISPMKNLEQNLPYTPEEEPSDIPKIQETSFLEPDPVTETSFASRGAELAPGYRVLADVEGGSVTKLSKDAQTLKNTKVQNTIQSSDPEDIGGLGDNLDSAETSAEAGGEVGGEAAGEAVGEAAAETGLDIAAGTLAEDPLTAPIAGLLAGISAIIGGVAGQHKVHPHIQTQPSFQFGA